MRKLYRSNHDRILAGVCAGIGEHVHVDPSLIRLFWAAGTLLSFGTGVVLYILAWFIIPDAPGGPGALFP